MKFYKITLRCGHVGRKKYVSISLPIKAENNLEATNKIIKHGGVKTHTLKDVLFVSEINKEEYLKLKDEVKNDPYFKGVKTEDYYKSIKSHGVYSCGYREKKNRPYEFRYLKEMAYQKSYLSEMKMVLCY